VAAGEGGWRTPAEYAAAAKRLAEQYSFARVAQERFEVQWDDLVGVATPLAQRVPIQTCHHPEAVLVHPDLSLSIGFSPSGFGIGFAVGHPAQFPDMWKVTRRLRGDYLPIVESEWTAGFLTVAQTAFAILPRDREVVTGKETQYVVVRLVVGNTNATPCDTPLYVLIGDAARDAGYGPFVTPLGRWQTPDRTGTLQNATLALNGRTVLAYRCNAPTEAAYSPKWVDATESAGHPDPLTNALRFQLALKPGEKRIINLVVAGNTTLFEASEGPEMAKVEFDTALQRAVDDWEGRLQPAMEYVTPEPRLNRLYRQLILSCLQNTRQIPGQPWHEPDQSPSPQGVWPWEFAHMAVPMMGLGYQQELRPSLRFLTEHQNGVGVHSANQMAEGDVKSMKGSFGGTAIIWMGDTGGALWALAEQYRYTRDAAWLKTNAPGMLAAWDWVQTARAQTRITGPDGKKVPYYGLLPPGRSSDEDGVECLFTFTDNLTWYAMSEIAKAFRQAGLPDADRLTREADEYRQCILEVIRQQEHVDPETNLRVFPNMIGGKIKVGWASNGPIQLYDTGLLSPTDERFAPMLEYTARKFGVLMGLMTHYAGGNQWYPNQAERAYYRCFLGRGEIEKSLLVFYSNLVYGRAHDTFQTMERFLVDDPNTSGFCPNASGNGRQLDMMRRMLIDEQDAAQGVLWLLRGCPRRWFAKGQTVAARKAPNLFGEMGVVMRSDGDTITVDVDAPAWESPKEIRLVLRHSDRKAIAEATVNGKKATVDGETVILPSPTGHLRVVCHY
jgi:hypothetical protein